MKRILLAMLALVLPITTVVAAGGPAFANGSGTDDCSCDCSCRWTGGGSFFDNVTGARVTHGFELYCDTDLGPNNLEVNWEGNRFHLTELTAVVCSYSAPLPPDPPKVDNCNTIWGQGVGRYNGVDGARITFYFTDQGEPGTKDTALVSIVDASGTPVLSMEGYSVPLTFGNHQAHRLTGNRAR